MVPQAVRRWLSSAAARAWAAEEGQTIAEYGLILGGLAVVLMAAAGTVVPWLGWW